MKKKILYRFISLITIVLSLLTISTVVINKYFDREYQSKENKIISNIVSQLGKSTSEINGNIDKLNIENKYMIIYDVNGKMIHSSLNLPQNIIDANKEIINIEGISNFKTSDNTNVVIFTKKLDDGNFLKVYDVQKSENSISNKFLKYLLATFFCLVLFSILMTNLFTNQILEPIRELYKVTNLISKGDLSSRIKILKNEELIPIGDNFNIIADKLETTILDFFEKQNQLDAILSSMNSGVIAIDKNGKILIFNKFAKKIFGVFGEIIGKNLSDVLSNIDLDALLTVEDEFRELEVGLYDPISLRYKTTALVGDNSNETGKVTVLSDVTDLKKLEQMRTQFVANVSHELKTPLTSIKGFSETLRDVHDEKTKNKFLDIIDAESERLRRLIDDILSLSSIENQREIGQEIVNALEITKDACSLLEPQAKIKKIDFSLITKGEPLFIGDNDKYKQLVINLVDNAIKYTESNGKVIVRLEENRNDFILTVDDTGTGIPKEHIPRLFERFYRVDKSRDRAKGGTGLGLAIVKHIVLGFKGSIEVESEVGKGTKFTIHIPQFREDDDFKINTKIQSHKYS